MTVVLFALAVAIALVGEKDAVPGRSALAKTALTGTVVLDPARPVCQVGQPCSKPIAGFKLAFSQRRQVVARTKTDRLGRYRVSLPPGRYSVAAPGHSGGPGRGLAPRLIRVRAVLHATVNFTYDAGIR